MKIYVEFLEIEFINFVYFFARNKLKVFLKEMIELLITVKCVCVCVCVCV